MKYYKKLMKICKKSIEICRKSMKNYRESVKICRKPMKMYRKLVQICVRKKQVFYGDPCFQKLKKSQIFFRKNTFLIRKTFFSQIFFSHQSPLMGSEKKLLVRKVAKFEEKTFFFSQKLAFWKKTVFFKIFLTPIPLDGG